MASLQERIEATLGTLPGQTVLAARRFAARGLALPLVTPADTDNGHSAPTVRAVDAIDVRAGLPLPAGRLATLPIAIELMRRVDLGQFRLEEPLSTEAQSLTLDKACARMLTQDDPQAANGILALLGMGEVNETTARLGLASTRLTLAFPAHPDAAHRENRTSAHDIVTLLGLIRSGALPGARRLREMLSDDNGQVIVTGALGEHAYEAGMLAGPHGTALYCALAASQPALSQAREAISACRQALWDTWCTEGA